MELNRSDDYVFVAVAMDVGGVNDAKPIYDRAKANFVTLVDADNALGQALDFKVVPNGFLVNEAGVIVQKWIGGFNVGSPKVMERIDSFLKEPAVAHLRPMAAKSLTVQITEAKEHVDSNPDDVDVRRNLARLLMKDGKYEEAQAHLSHVIGIDEKNPDNWFLLGRSHLAQGNKEQALDCLRRALKLDPEDFIIRKQIWSITYPEKFHPTIDWNWQREQLKKEREAEKGDGWLAFRSAPLTVPQ